MSKSMRLLLVFLCFWGSAQAIWARPDVGFPDTSAYLSTPYNPDNNRELKFEIENGPVAGIHLPNRYYNLEDLRAFASRYVFADRAIGEEIKFSLGSPGEAFGNSFSSQFYSKPFLEALQKMLEAFNEQSSAR